MKVTCISDLHGQLPRNIAPCDLLLVAGDVCPNINPVGSGADIEYQRQWLEDCFAPWLNSVPSKETVMVFGNHDFIAERAFGIIPPLKARILQDSGVEVLGKKIWGTPKCCMPFKRWAFTATEDEIKETLSNIDPMTEIVLSHGPAYGILDNVSGYGPVGSKALYNCLKWGLNPRLAVVGHIHEQHGVDSRSINGTTVVNASLLDDRYEMVYDPVTLEID
jgi:Icc-related predicted phosphoesterase